MTTGTAKGAETHTPIGTVEHRLTARSLIAGGAFGTFMCAVNTYLTLRFGIIEEGPMIAAIFLFSATIGVLSVIAFRHLLVVKDEQLPEDRRLPWIGAKAIKGVIDPFLTRSDPRQSVYPALFTTLAATYVLFNTSGVGMLPEKIEIGIFGLSAFGAGVLNLIATRAYAQTYFNPVRVMGVLWAILENSGRLRRFIPGSIGFGVGLVISPAIDFAFFAGGIIMLFVLRRLFKVSDATLATLAIGGIVGEGIGGLSQGIFKALGVI